MNGAVPSGDRRAPWSTCLWSPGALVLAATGILMCYGNVQAESFERDIEFAARYVTGELDLQDGTVTIWNRIRRAGIEYDERYGGGVAIGLIGGYGTLNQNDGARGREQTFRSGAATFTKIWEETRQPGRAPLTGRSGASTLGFRTAWHGNGSWSLAGATTGSWPTR